MRRAGLAALGSGAILAATAAIALAAPATITGKADNTWDAASYTHDAGTVAQMVIAGSSHNATATTNGADGKPLFASPTLSTGASTGVNGTQYLGPGSYAFICTLHPATMGATLVVGAGTPQPRPTATLKVLDTKLSKVVKKSALRVRVTTTGQEKTELTGKLGSKEVVTGTEITGAATKTVKLPLTPKGHTKLEKLKKAKLKVEANVAFGSPVTATAKLK